MRQGDLKKGYGAQGVHQGRVVRVVSYTPHHCPRRLEFDLVPAKIHQGPGLFDVEEVGPTPKSISPLASEAKRRIYLRASERGQRWNRLMGWSFEAAMLWVRVYESPASTESGPDSNTTPKRRGWKELGKWKE